MSLPGVGEGVGDGAGPGVGAGELPAVTLVVKLTLPSLFWVTALTVTSGAAATAISAWLFVALARSSLASIKPANAFAVQEPSSP